MLLEVIKVINNKIGVFEVFCYGASSQHDGYHVGSTPQGFVHSGKLSGTQECNPMAFKYDVKVIIILLMVCYYQLNPIANIFIVVTIDIIGPDLQENMFGVGA
jgi:hypothetical protein